MKRPPTLASCATRSFGKGSGVKTVAAAITLAITLGIAGPAFAQTPTPDPAPVPAPAPTSTPPPPAPSSDTSTSTSTDRTPVAAEPVRKKKRAATKARPRAKEAGVVRSVPLHPPLAERASAPVVRTSSQVPVKRPVPALAASQHSDWPARAGLLFLLVMGVLGLVLALAPVRALAAISASLPRRRQDLGLALALAMALGAGFFVVLMAV